MTVKSLDELLEVLPSVVGARRGLRMVLNSENRVLAVLHPFDGPVVEVKVGDLKRLRTRHSPGVAVHHESMVLRRDKYLSRMEIPHRVVSPPVSVRELYRLAAERQTEQLMPETDPKDRQ